MTSGTRIENSHSKRDRDGDSAFCGIKVDAKVLKLVESGFREGSRQG